VVLYAGGLVDNGAGGVISSNVGVNILGGAGTVTNAGRIAGNGGVAVALAGGFANRVIVQPGAVFTGQVNGGNTVGAPVASTLELAAAGTTRASLYGFGTDTGFINFADVTIDSGANWRLVNTLVPLSLAAGSMFTDSGTLNFFTSLTNAGLMVETLTNASIRIGFAFTNAAGGTVIAAGTAAGTALYAPSVYNAGLIDGQGNSPGNSTLQPAAAVASNMVTNAGTIGSSGAGILSAGGGGVTNLAGGVIDAVGDAIIGGTIYYPPPLQRPEVLNIFNAGLISNTGTLNSVAIQSDVTAFVTNAVGGTIGSSDGGLEGVAALYNAGAIQTRETSFIGGSVSNAASGRISSGEGSVAVSAATVSNAGTIAAYGSNADAIVLHGYGVQRLVVDPGAVFIGNVDGGATAGATQSSVLELAAGSGVIEGFGSSFANFNTLQFDPGAAWSLSASVPAALAGGVTLVGFTTGDTIALQGVTETIAGFANGTLALEGSESLNLLIPGAYIAQEFSATGVGGDTDLTFVPSGAGRTISQGYTSGITLTGAGDNPVVVTGSIDTDPGAALTGAAPVAWTIGNTGLIRSTATNGTGVQLAAGGSIANAAAAVIAGGQYGVSIAGGAGSVTNGGSIAGGLDAVRLLAAGFANRVVILPGARFSGVVEGGNRPGGSVVSTLELAPGLKPGTLTGLGVGYVSFGEITVDAGARWTLAGTSTLAAGMTLGFGGSLYDAAILTNAGTIPSMLSMVGGATVFINAGGAAQRRRQRRAGAGRRHGDECRQHRRDGGSLSGRG
jgi:hypothetical protein